MSDPLVITIIPNWNLKQDLGECLQSLQQADYARHQIVVVDNASQDGSPEYVRANFPEVHLICLSENRGYAGALNVGFEYALTQGAEYVFALNNDTVVKPDVLKRLVEVCEAAPQIGIATPKILYFQRPEMLFGLGDRSYPFLPTPIGYGYRKRDQERYSAVMDFDYVTGCAMLIRAETLLKIGGFDTSYFMYYEDGDFCYRVRQRGYRIVCVGDATILHKAALSTSKVKANSTRLRARNRVWFYRRYPHGPHPSLTYLTLLIVAVWKSIRYVFQRRPDLLKAYWQGLSEGIRTPLPIPQVQLKQS
jgi:GT2 family glycosyltransferase